VRRGDVLELALVLPLYDAVDEHRTNEE